MLDQSYVLTMSSQIVHSIFIFPKINMSVQCWELQGFEMDGVFFYFFAKLGGHGSLEMINNSDLNNKT